ncbi:MAG: MbnP family protein [Pseudomonadota bacterium]
MLGKQTLVAFVATTDAARARAFYEETLGLSLVSSDPYALVFEANGTTIRVQKLTAFQPQPFTALGWTVDDIHAVVTALQKKDVVCERFPPGWTKTRRGSGLHPAAHAWLGSKIRTETCSHSRNFEWTTAAGRNSWTQIWGAWRFGACKLAPMTLRWPAVLLAGAAAWAGSLACSSDAHNGAGPQGGAAGISGASHGGSGVGGAGAGLADSACLEHPTPLRTQGTVLSFALRLVLSGKPFVFGQPNALADGGSLVPLNLRFYISEVSLLPSGGEPPVAVDVVTAAGAPEPYGVHFFNAEEADSGTLRVLAPPGQYSGVSFALGIKLSCNQQTPASLADPLTDTSQMTWPHTGGFLFLRYEALHTAADGSDASSADADSKFPPMVHMGGNISEELVPHVTVTGALSVPESGTLETGLSVVMDEIFKGATADIDVSDVINGPLAGPDSEAGERLRRELPELHAFVLEP